MKEDMKTIITDIDGTLYQNGVISDYSIEILKEFQKENRLVLASGRNLKSIKMISDDLEMSHYRTGAYILVNGCVLYDFKDDSIEILKTLSGKDVKKIKWYGILSFSRIRAVNLKEHVDIFTIMFPIYQVARKLIRGREMEHFIKKDIPEDVLKMELCSKLWDFPWIYRLFKKMVSKHYACYQVSTNWVEIMPKGIGKEHLVDVYLKKYQINKDDLYIFGDGENDKEMLKMTSHSYAPEHSMASCVSNNVMSKIDGVANIAKEIM